jgi:hypothetical protein
LSPRFASKWLDLQKKLSAGETPWHIRRVLAVVVKVICGMLVVHFVGAKLAARRFLKNTVNPKTY